GDRHRRGRGVGARFDFQIRTGGQRIGHARQRHFRRVRVDGHLEAGAELDAGEAEHHRAIDHAGDAAVINGAVMLSFPGVEFSTGFKVTINTNTTEVTLPGVPDPLPAGPYLKVEAGTDAAPATMTIAGQTLSGKFAFEQYTVAGTGDRRPRQHRRLPAATRT